MPVVGQNLTIDEAEDIGDNLLGPVKSGGGSKKSKDIGGKTFRSIRREEVDNSKKKRREKAEKQVIQSLKQIPKSDSSEVMDRNITEYINWLVDSLRINQPIIKTSDLEYSQFSAGGPGGQNVNKVANAVLYKHKITGLFANSRDSRNTIENRNHAAEILYEDLTSLVNNWKVILKDIQTEKLKVASETFIKRVIEEDK